MGDVGRFRLVMAVTGLGVLNVLCSTCYASSTSGGLSLSVKPGDNLSGLMDRVRAKRDKARPFEVVFEDGVYSVGKTIQLKKADSNIVFRARNAGRVTFVGGTKFPASAAKRGVPKSVVSRLKPEAAAQAYSLEVPAAERELFAKKGSLGSSVTTGEEAFPRAGYNWIKGQGDTYPCFTVDGLHMPLAGWPQKGEYYKQTKEKCVASGVIGNPTEEASKWMLSSNESYVCIWGFTMGNCAFVQTMKTVAGRDEEGHILVKKGWGEIKPGSRFRFINVMEELDEPGEWCYDHDEFGSGCICFIPPEGYSDKSFLAIGTLMDNFFRIAADNTMVEGIRFTAKIGLPAVAIEEKARNCKLQGCAFTALNTYAVFAAGRGTLVRSCDFTDISGAGVYLTGGSLKNRDRGGNTVENCLFERCCILHCGWASGGLYVAGFGNALRHNVIHDSVEHALDYSGFGHVIEYNRTSEASTMFGDSAAVYSPGGFLSFGNVFRYNDVGARRGYVNAFYADDFSSGHQVYGNIFREFGHFGIFFGGGRDNLISNNVVTAGQGGMHIDNRGLWWPAYKEPAKIRASLVKNYDYTNDYVRALYPAFSAWNDETTNMCGYCNNSWVNNVMVDCESGVDLQECMDITIPTNSLLSVGNVYVRNEGGGSTNFWRIGGVTRVAGTKEAPLGIKADDNAALRKLCPGWRDIPFAKIGLYVDQWRKTVR